MFIQEEELVYLKNASHSSHCLEGEVNGQNIANIDIDSK